MKTIIYKIVFLGLISLVFSGYVLAKEVGEVTRLKGRADATRDLTARELSIGDKIHDDDVLRTKSESLMEVTMKDDSKLTLDENTNLIIRKYIISENPQGLLELTRGKFRAFVANLFSSRKESFQVKTKTAVVGVQGTEFEVYLVSLSTRVLVYSGIVSVRNIDPNVKGEQILQKGESATVKEGQAPLPVEFVTGIEGREPSIVKSDIKSGSLQDLKSGGRQHMDPTGITPSGPAGVRLPREPHPP